MKNFIKAIFAGALIAIACLVSIGANGGFVGAILFSIGLLLIILNGYNLYTGKIGYIENIKEIKTMLLYILGNVLGCLLISFTTTVSTQEIIQAKLSSPYYLVFFRAIGCGFLIYIAVDVYKTKQKLWGVLAVPAFILSGFEHSIADAFYIIKGGIYNYRVLLFFIVVVVGNAVGSLIHKLIK